MTFSCMLPRLILCLLFAGMSFTVQAATLLVFGDSLSAGYGLARDQGWVSLLGKRLAAEGLDYKVVNASISGETAQGGANRMSEALKTHKPDVVVIALGANDGLRGSALATLARSLESMVDASRRSGARVLLIGMQLPPNYGTEYVEKFRRTFADVARSRKVPLVPFLLDGFAGDLSMFQADGLHPTAQAQPRILDTVWPQLRPLLK